MKNNNLYIDLHVLQTVPPSCVNRDDTGSPKTAVYGGVTRARVSSQAWKHEMRLSFENFMSKCVSKENAEETSDLAKRGNGYRTRHLVKLVYDEICKISDIPDAEQKAEKAVKMALLTDKKRKNQEEDEKKKEKKKVKEEPFDKRTMSEVLIFANKIQISEIAKLAINGETDSSKYKKAFNSMPSLDMILFGRMVADDPTLNFDAAAQVAHAISTHEVRNEYDYFTAVDDCSPEDNAGAGHLGTVEFNSSTLYRYATVNVSELARGLATDDLAKAVRCFAEAFICTMPTGKQNTFANRTLPDMVYAAVRRDQPVNLVGAFERPVKSSGGYVESSENAFCDYAKEVYRLFAPKPELSLGVSRHDRLSEICELMPLSELLDRIAAYVSDNFAAGV